MGQGVVVAGRGGGGGFAEEMLMRVTGMTSWSE